VIGDDMRFQPFGRHLHNQIVIPLLAASVVVALVASFVAVYLLSGIVDAWVQGSTAQAISAVQSSLEQVDMRLDLDTKLVIQDPRMVAAMSAGDWAAVERLFAETRASAVVDDLMLLDDKGRVLAKSGDYPTRVGASPLSEDQQKLVSANTPFSSLIEVGDYTTLVAFRGQTVGTSAGPRTYTLVAGRSISTEFLRASFRGVAAGIVYLGPGHLLRARYVDPERAAPLGTRGSNAYAQLTEAIDKLDPAIRAALAAPDKTTTFSAGDQQFTVRSATVRLAPGESTGGAERARAVDPTGSTGHIVVFLNNAVAVETGRTTVSLIGFWSVLAVIVLTGLGTIIARRVSAPLNNLSESARRVADGDFSARVEIKGVNEVAELSESFNVMTESLKERTETLTKKVLELATLYEMSRALGSTLDLDVLLDSVIDSALRIFNVDSGYVMIRDKVTGGLDLRAWRGMASVKPDDRAVRSSMSDWVVRQGRPLIFNPPQDDQAEQHVDSVTGALAALSVPLVSTEGVVGAICVGSRDREYRFSSDDVRLLSTIANHVTIAIGNIELFSSLQEAYLATVRSLAAAVDAKDPFTRGHSDRVAHFAQAIAEQLELSTEQCTALEMAAYLHDIGKIGIRESILLKPGKLDDDEYGQMKHHPLIGANILRPVAFPWPIAPVVRHHHEHYDGAGYPAGLKGEEIPLLARILTVADAYEAMTSDRPYRLGRTQEEALEELDVCQGSHFDPRVVDAFVQALQILDDRAAARVQRAAEEVQPDEARAIFVAICDGMFASFRRLGGPRLASNLESALEEQVHLAELPYSMQSGHMTVDWEKAGDVEKQITDMRTIVQSMSALMEATAGRSLVDHFHDEAVEALSHRMRHLADTLGLYERD
jgi:putative nucleotidyltransferase with HDIG domain